MANSALKFYVPRTLESDFDNFLKSDIPGAVMDFTLISDWYDQTANKTIRGEIYPDSTKSRYSNTDNNLNFRASKSSGIKKGDMVIDPDGTIYLFDWEIPSQPNNRQTRAVRCNTKLTFSKYQQQETDEMGYLVTKEGWQTIAQDIPCNAYRYDGRPEYSAVAGNPGIIPNALTIVNVQYNSYTKKIDIDDEFTWAGTTYVVIDVSYNGVNIDLSSGVLTLQCKKKAGGDLE